MWSPTEFQFFFDLFSGAATVSGRIVDGSRWE